MPSDAQRRHSIAYDNLKKIGDMLRNDRDLTTAEQLDWMVEFLDRRCFFGSIRNSDAAKACAELVKKDLHLLPADALVTRSTKVD